MFFVIKLNVNFILFLPTQFLLYLCHYTILYINCFLNIIFSVNQDNNNNKMIMDYGIILLSTYGKSVTIIIFDIQYIYYYFII